MVIRPLILKLFRNLDPVPPKAGREFHKIVTRFYNHALIINIAEIMIDKYEFIF
jgi:hypothetical protein